jgi:hypothetical protein
MDRFMLPNRALHETLAKAMATAAGRDEQNRGPK